MEIVDGRDRGGGSGVNDRRSGAIAGDVRLFDLAAGIFIDGLFDGIVDEPIVPESRRQFERDRHDHRDGLSGPRGSGERFVVDEPVNNRYDRHTQQCIGFLHPA
jgi:hypothetical protein